MRFVFPHLFVAMCMLSMPDYSQRSADAPVAANDQESAESGPDAIADLRTALGYMAWKSQQRGPLLLIDPANVRPAPQPQADALLDSPFDSTRLLYPPARGSSLTSDSVANYFGLHLVKQSTISALVPDQIVVLNQHLKAPDVRAQYGDSDRLRQFIATLSVAQWRLIGSDNGIDADDLNRRQQRLFQALLPNHVKIETQKLTPDPSSDNTTYADNVQQTDVTNEQRQDIRIRLDLTSNIGLLGPKHDYTVGSVNGSALRGLETHLIDADEPLFIGHGRATEPTRFGQPTQLWLLNRMKPGQLDFTLPSLDAPISLASATTVGDLIKRVREKSGLRIYADARLARLPIWLGGANLPVRASDLLKILCLELTATFRKIEPDSTKEIARDPAPVYILTHDIRGLACLQAEIEAWIQHGENAQQALENKDEAAIQSLNPLQFVHGASDDLMAPTAAVMKAINAGWNHSHPDGWRGENDVPVSALSPIQQAAVHRVVVQTIAENQSESRLDFTGIDSSRVRTNIKFVVSFVVPGFGIAQSDITWQNFGLDADVWSRFEDKTKNVPRSSLEPQDCILNVAPKSLVECDEIMKVAKTKGIDQVWIQVKDDSTGRAILKQAVSIGISQNTKVCALLSLMHAPTPSLAAENDKVAGSMASTHPTTSHQSQDLNLFGETGSERAARTPPETLEPNLMSVWSDPPSRVDCDVLAPDADDALTILIRRLNNLATIQGLAGIALKDVAEPGHDWLGQNSSNGSDPLDDFGYTVANRIQFIERQGFDPIDLPIQGNGQIPELMAMCVGIRNFDFDGANQYATVESCPDCHIALESWSELRVAQQTRLLQDLYGAFRKHQPKMLLWIANPHGDTASATFDCWTHSTVLLPKPKNGQVGSKPPGLDGASRPLARGAIRWRICTQELVKQAINAARGTSHEGQARSLFRLLNTATAGKSVNDPSDAPIVLDFTEMSITETVGWLRDGLVDPHKP